MNGRASITRSTFGSATDVIAYQGGMSAGRLIIRVSENTRMAINSEGELDYNYLTLAGSSTIVLDPPNLFGDDTLYFRLDTASTGVIEVVRC